MAQAVLTATKRMKGGIEGPKSLPILTKWVEAELAQVCLAATAIALYGREEEFGLEEVVFQTATIQPGKVKTPRVTLRNVLGADHKTVGTLPKVVIQAPMLAPQVQQDAVRGGRPGFEYGVVAVRAEGGKRSIIDHGLFHKAKGESGGGFLRTYFDIMGVHLETSSVVQQTKKPRYIHHWMVQADKDVARRVVLDMRRVFAGYDPTPSPKDRDVEGVEDGEEESKGGSTTKDTSQANIVKKASSHILSWVWRARDAFETAWKKEFGTAPFPNSATGCADTVVV